MDILNKENVKNPTTITAFLFYVMNAWVELDMARMRGEMDHDTQSEVFSMMLKPVASVWADLVRNEEALSSQEIVDIIDMENSIKTFVKNTIGI